MLKKFRKASESLLIKILFLVLALSFVIWGIGDAIRNQDDTHLVTFKYAKPITRVDFLKGRAEEVNRIKHMTNNQISIEQLENMDLTGQVLGKLIQARMLEYLAKSYNLDLSNKALLNEIAQYNHFHNKQGFFDKNIFKTALKNANLTEQEFFNQLKTDLLARILLSSFNNSKITPTSALAEHFYDYINERRFVTVARREMNQKHADVNFSDNDLQDYYRTHQEQFFSTEARDFQTLELRLDNIKKNIVVSEEEVKNYYNTKEEEFTKPETFSFYNFSFTSLDKAEKFEKEATSLSLDQAIKLYTELSGQKDKLKFEGIPAKSLNPNIYYNLKGLTEKAYSKVIKNNNEFIVLKLINKTDKLKQSFASVKESLSKNLFEQKANNKFLELSQFIEDEIAGGATLNEISKKFNLPLVKHSKITQNSNEVSPAILKIAYELNTAEISELTEYEKNAFVTVEVTSIDKPKLKLFESVKEQVKKALEAESAISFNKKAIADLEKAKSLEEFQEIAKANDFSVAQFYIPRKNIGANDSRFSQNLGVKIFSNPADSIVSDMDQYFASAAYINGISKNQSRPKDKMADISKNIEASFINNIIDGMLLYAQQINKIQINYSDPIFKVRNK